MKIGIIGGSGLYDLEGIEGIEECIVETPFGDPSDPYICGKFASRDVCFLPRHGKGHRLLPSEINHRANVYGFKKLGVDCVISVSAVGSLKEEHRPRDVVLPDQYFDRTKKALEHTFFGDGIVAHVSFGEPTCGELREVIARVARAVISGLPEADTRVADSGTYVNMEGPAFSTKAESNFYRSQGFDIIGMTSLGEAKLCREAEICYQGIAMVTDYDCWHETEEAVNVEMVIGHLTANTALAKRMLVALIPELPESRSCVCGQALAGALLARRDAMPAAQLKKLSLLIEKHL